jgi:hypothetical protein
MDRGRLRELEEEDLLEGEDLSQDEEEESDGELIVVDDDLIASLLLGISEDNPMALAQSTDVILGALDHKKTVVLDEGLSASPLTNLLPELCKHLKALFSSSKEGSAKREKVGHLLEILAPAVLDSADKFAKKKAMFEIFCDAIVLLKEHGKGSATSAFVSAMRLGLSKPSYTPIVIGLSHRMIEDPAFAVTTLQLQYRELVRNANERTLTDGLPQIREFFVAHREQAVPYVKQLVQRLCSEMLDDLTKGEKSVISWATVATCELVADFAVATEDKRFVHPIQTLLLAFLKHFPIKNYVPFQLRIAQCAHKFGVAMDSFAPIVSWVVDALQFVCSCQCKGKAQFSWDSDLTSPDMFSFEFAHQALDRLKRLFFAEIALHGKFIAFPELAMPIKARLVEIAKGSKNRQIAVEVNPLVKTLDEQQKFLISVKRELNWTTRNEQLVLWNAKMAEVVTPLDLIVDRQKKVEAQLNKMKAPLPGKMTDEQTGDILEVATVDDV